MSIQDNIKAIKSELPPQVKLVAVSKFHPSDAIREAVEAGQVAFGENRPQEMEKKAEEAKALLERVKTALGDKVLDVRLTDRLKNAAACLCGDEGMSVEMYKVLRSMPNGNSIPMTFHFELNPDHPVYAKLNDLDDEQLKTYAELLLAQATLVAGLPLDDPAAFAEAMLKLM